MNYGSNLMLVRGIYRWIFVVAVFALLNCKVSAWPWPVNWVCFDFMNLRNNTASVWVGLGPDIEHLSRHYVSLGYTGGTAVRVHVFHIGGAYSPTKVWFGSDLSTYVWGPETWISEDAYDYENVHYDHAFLVPGMYGIDPYKIFEYDVQNTSDHERTYTLTDAEGNVLESYSLLAGQSHHGRVYAEEESDMNLSWIGQGMDGVGELGGLWSSDGMGWHDPSTDPTVVNWNNRGGMDDIGWTSTNIFTTNIYGTSNIVNGTWLTEATGRQGFNTLHADNNYIGTKLGSLWTKIGSAVDGLWSNMFIRDSNSIFSATNGWADKMTDASAARVSVSNSLKTAYGTNSVTLASGSIGVDTLGLYGGHTANWHLQGDVWDTICWFTRALIKMALSFLMVVVLYLVLRREMKLFVGFGQSSAGCDKVTIPFRAAVAIAMTVALVGLPSLALVLFPSSLLYAVDFSGLFVGVWAESYGILNGLLDIPFVIACVCLTLAFDKGASIIGLASVWFFRVLNHALVFAVLLGGLGVCCGDVYNVEFSNWRTNVVELRVLHPSMWPYQYRGNVMPGDTVKCNNVVSNSLVQVYENGVYFGDCRLVANAKVVAGISGLGGLGLWVSVGEDQSNNAPWRMMLSGLVWGASVGAVVWCVRWAKRLMAVTME